VPTKHNRLGDFRKGDPKGSPFLFVSIFPNLCRMAVSARGFGVVCQLRLMMPELSRSMGGVGVLLAHDHLQVGLPVAAAARRIRPYV
jgi:hypothetical protein